MLEKLLIVLMVFPLLVSVFNFFAALLLLPVAAILPDTEWAGHTVTIIGYALSGVTSFQLCRSVWPRPSHQGGDDHEARMLYMEKQLFRAGEYSEVTRRMRKRLRIRLAVGLVATGWSVFGAILVPEGPSLGFNLIITGLIAGACTFDVVRTMRLSREIEGLQSVGESEAPNAA